MSLNRVELTWIEAALYEMRISIDVVYSVKQREQLSAIHKRIVEELQSC